MSQNTKETTALLKSQSQNDNNTDNSNKRRNYGATTSTYLDNIEDINEEDIINTESIQSIPSTSTSESTSGSTSSSSIKDQEQNKSSMRFIHKFGFGLGHIYNDLCAGVWFSYTLLFMQATLQLPATESGALVMLGQVSDALATPIVGLLADKFGTKRKWHMFGTGLVFVTFPMIFSLCPWCKTTPNWWPAVYFAIFIILFQFAWAIVQISHLSIIPEMSITMKDRADLTATRYSASVISNVIVYIITWAVLKNHNKFEKNIGPSDAFRFRDISLILTLIGLTMSILFHFSLSMSGYERRRLLTANYYINDKQRRSSNIENNINNDSTDNEQLINNTIASDTNVLLETNKTVKKKNFFKSPQLYQNAFLYVFSRLFMTTSLLYMPMWLDERSWVPQPNIPKINITDITTTNNNNNNIEHLATVPLVSFLASFIASMGLKHISPKIGHQFAYLIGTIISIIGCVWVAIAKPETFTSYILYSIAVLFGAGSTITMISSLCITAVMIGRHTNQGGFIYSAVTFADKLITGIVVIIIESCKCKNREQCPEYYRNVLAYGCGIAASLGIFTLLTLRCTKRNNANVNR